MKIYDATKSIYEDMPKSIYYEGFKKTFTMKIEDGICDVTRICIDSHLGTHMDAPCHFVAGARDISEIPVENFYTSCTVIEVKDNITVTTEFLEDKNLITKVYLFKFGDYRENEDTPYITPEAALYLKSLGAVGIGLDNSSMDENSSTSFPAHKAVLGADMYIIENAVLENVPEGVYKIICPPLKVLKNEASPIRLLLIEE